ncbi:MAG: permease-like cell division protein FtsX [Bacillus sp. (in: Bacteria)]|nr:permease-like cell division protein FtsX [Bacillus sp. (in: firmicutes)]MCM1427889.1 permease-like cell division protein FtsX [Eubacterium sp.]
MGIESKREDNISGMDTDNQIERWLNNAEWQNALKAVTMPEGMKKDLIMTGARQSGQKNIFRRFRYAKLAAAACMAVILATTGITAHAVYVNTHLNVFVTHDITNEQLSDLENELRHIEGISSCRYISGDEAWEEFSETYLTPELAESFDDNPLADSANLRVGVSFHTDIEEIRKAVEELDGVRRVSGLWEE